MKKHLVIAGGGHAHMLTLAKLDRFVEKGVAVTVIGPSAHHYYSGMGPGMLGKIYMPEEIRFETKRVVEKKGGNFVLGSVVRIDADAQKVYLESGETVPYDVLSCNLGSRIPQQILKGSLEDIYPVKPIERLLAAQKRILELAARKQIAIAIIGGGPSAVEIAGNIWRLIRAPGLQTADIRILTSGKLMPDHPDGVRNRALASMQSRGITILENCRVDEISTGRVTDTRGNIHRFDIIFLAVGVKPSPVFSASAIPTGPDGGMRVNRYLQSVTYTNIFGGGDCIFFEEAPLDKVGVYAVRQNPILLHNLMATIEGKALKPFEPGGKYLLIFNLGDGTGIFHKWWIQFGGRLAFRFKDYLDRRFMRTFQAIEE